MDIALRCFVDNPSKKPPVEKPYYNKHLVFCYDTETVPDPFMEILFLSYQVYENDRLHETALCYGNVNTKQLNTLKSYAKKHGLKLISREEFVERFFFYVYERRAVCVGMNLNFDLSRIAIGWNTSKLDKTAFSLKLSDNKKYPRIYIRNLNSKHSFIRFVPPYAKNKKNKKHYHGVFCDVKTLTFALTNKSHSLESACKLFKTEYQKQKPKQHGVIDFDYISYNISDVSATFSLYQALSKRVELYGIPAEPYEITSPASIGSTYYKAMGITPFLQQCPDFDKQILGYAMTAYAGARVEARVRHIPTISTYNDALSMYPSNFVRMKFWDFIIANSIVVEEDPEFVTFLENVKLEDLIDNKLWASKLRGMALVELDEDIFPVRGKYGNKIVNGIGVNYAKGGPLWYSYPDIVASKLLTNGKVARVLKSYKFVPIGVQQGLKPIILFGKKVDPIDTDLIKYLIERRLQIKKLLKNDPDNEDLKNEDHIAKIICNSVSYGKTVQIDVSDTLNLKVDVYGVKDFQTVVQKEERPGELFCPMLGVLATSGARLILAIAETYIQREGGYHIYMDTDAIVTVDPKRAGIANKLREVTAPLNPYSEKTDVFKIEKADDGTTLDKQLCFCISSKRYCWFKWNGDRIEILKASNHGLGFMLYMSGDNLIDFWKNILYYHFGKLSKQDIETKYAGRYVSQQLTITSPQVLKRFKSVVKGRLRISPFCFMVTGQAYRINQKTREPIIPVVPFTKDFEKVPYQPFFDLRTGKVYSENTEYYWKPLSEVFFDFYEHKEEKFDGTVGELKRKHITIEGINLIGKESNDLEQTEAIGADTDAYVYYNDNLKQKIAKRLEALTKGEALSIGMSAWQFYYLKKKISHNEIPKLKKKTLRLLGLL